MDESGAATDVDESATSGTERIDGNRRSLLKSLAATAASVLLLSAGRAGAARPPAALPRLIDAHCHLFNVTDLAAARFAYVVLLEKYQSETASRPSSTWLYRRIEGAIRLLSRGVLTAAQETALLASGAPAASEASAPVADEDRAALRTIQREIEAAPPAAADAVAPAAPPPPGLCESRGARRSTNIGTIFEWLGLMRSSRSRLADTLTRLHRESRYEPSLLCPALVDYSCWLDQTLASPLPDQIEVMGRIALRPDGPAIHAYVPFDPLRAVMFRANIQGPDGHWDPFALVESALTRHGCIGVKLYPAMGFRVAGNAASGQSYPGRVAALFGGPAALGRALDTALDEFWRLCRRLDAPVIAHAANSNHGGPHYGTRGDPAFWTQVLAPALRQRVLFGHFGRFTTMSAEQPMPAECPRVIPVERTWEAVFARHVQANPDAPVFADISYLSEVFDAAQRRRIQQLMAYYLRHDPDARHLVFGSDWTMMGIEKKFDDRPGYATRVADFLGQCGITGDKLERVMHGNAIGFLGLGAGEANRDRLVGFYHAHGQSPDRLPQA